MVSFVRHISHRSRFTQNQLTALYLRASRVLLYVFFQSSCPLFTSCDPWPTGLLRPWRAKGNWTGNAVGPNCLLRKSFPSPRWNTVVHAPPGVTNSFACVPVRPVFSMDTSFCCLSSSLMRISLASALAALFAASLASAWWTDTETQKQTDKLGLRQFGCIEVKNIWK